MSAPAPSPTFVPPPPNAFGNPSGGFWPENSFDNEQSRQTLLPEQPYFKKPKLSEDNPNHNMTPRMPPPARGQGKLFFKTRHCEKFREGTCPYGSNCNFAHGEEDLRKPPPNWQEIVGFHVGGGDRMDKWDEDMSIINRHRLCKNFFSGRVCPYGERCNYRHEDPGKFRESAVININTTPTPMDIGRSVQSDNVVTVSSNFDASRMNSKPVTWKTRMCHKWMETLGNCPFGDKCHFAHGEAELKKLTGHNEMETGNVNTAPPKPLPNPSSSGDAFLSGTVEGGSSRKPVLSKFLSKWKGPEKINRIYADWIDDIHLAKSSPSKYDN